MNLAEIDQNLREGLLKREDCIGFFVINGTYDWIIDWEAHFNLDQQKNIDAMCTEPRYRRFMPAGLTPEQWNRKQQNEFRNGLPTLTADLFPVYRGGEAAKVVTTELLHQEFFIEDQGQYSELSKSIEQSLSFDAGASEDMIQLRMRLFSKLPKFYINYDRKIFMHMVRGRFYDKVVLDGWWGAECDFEHMIPTSHRYWVRSTDEDFWAVTNFSNG